MPLVRNHGGTEDIYLTRVDQFSDSEDAANALWKSVHDASKKYGGVAFMRTPDDGVWGYEVQWKDGPKGWATAYTVSEGADAPGFVAQAEEENSIVRFVDLD